MALRHRFIYIVLPLLEWRHVRSINSLLVSLHSWIACWYWIHNQSASIPRQTFTTFWNYTQIPPFFLSHSNSFFVYLILDSYMAVHWPHHRSCLSLVIWCNSCLPWMLPWWLLSNAWRLNEATKAGVQCGQICETYLQDISRLKYVIVCRCT